MTVEVTFLVPAHNAEATILSTLNSILDQDAEGVCRRVIVINDGSTDSTRDLVNQFVDRHPDENTLVLEGERRGEAAALNAGLEQAKGEYIALVESDVTLDKCWLRCCLAALEEDGVAGAGGYLEGRPGDPWIARLAAIEVEVKLAEQPPYAVHITSANALYHAWAFEKVGPFREELYNATLDSDFNARLVEAGYRLRFVREARATHAYKASLRGYLERYFWYGRFRRQVQQRYLYPGDRWVAASVVFTAIAYGTLLLIPVYPLLTVTAWCVSLVVNGLWTFQLARYRRESALLVFPLVLILRNTTALIGILTGLFSKKHDVTPSRRSTSGRQNG